MARFTRSTTRPCSPSAGCKAASLALGVSSFGGHRPPLQFRALARGADAAARRPCHLDADAPSSDQINPARKITVIQSQSGSCRSEGSHLFSRTHANVIGVIHRAHVGSFACAQDDKALCDQQRDLCSPSVGCKAASLDLGVSSFGGHRPPLQLFLKASAASRPVASGPGDEP